MDTPWVTLIWNTHYSNKVPHAHDLCGSFWWRDVCKLSPIYRGISKCSIVKGDTILFWKDPWKDQLASESYPRAFSFALDEDVSATDFLSADTLGANFHLPLSSQAIQELRHAQEDTAHIVLDNSSNDKWSYLWGSDQYSSSQYYKFCFRELVPHESFNWIWKSKSIPRIKFFCWLLLSDRLNTRNMLRRRHYNVGNNFICTMCNAGVEETVEHLFFHCDFSKDCWGKLNFPISPNVMATRLELISFSRTHWTKQMFMDVFSTAAWSIWKERNNYYFNGITPSTSAWAARFKEDFRLLVHRTKDSKHSFINSIVSTL